MSKVTGVENQAKFRVVTCDFFQGHSVSISVSMKKLVVGSISVFIHVYQILYGLPNI